MTKHIEVKRFERLFQNGGSSQMVCQVGNIDGRTCPELLSVIRCGFDCGLLLALVVVVVVVCAFIRSSG